MAGSSYVLDVRATPAVIEWVDPDGLTRYLRDGSRPQPRNQMLFDLYYDTSSNTSFFKLCIPFITKFRSRKNTSLYLFIPPERVVTLVAECPDVPEAVRQQLGTDVVRLRFDLNKPADLVIPRVYLSPKNSFYEDTLYVSATLAQQTTIAIYVARPLTKEQLRPLCDAVSLRRLSSSESHANPSAQGGRVCTEIDELLQEYQPKPLYPAEAGPSGTRQQDDTSRAISVLPPYAEQSSSSRIAGLGFSDNPKKRPRHSSNADQEGTDNHIEGEHAVLRRQVAEMFGGLGKRMDAMNEEMQETKQELLETKRELQTTRLELQATKRETNRKLHATFEELLATRKVADAMRGVQREAKHKLRDTSQELQTTKQEIAQDLSEIEAKMDKEALRLYRLQGQNVELFMSRQTTVEEFLYEAVELLKGLMELVSQTMGKEEDANPEAQALATFMTSTFGRTTGMTGTTGMMARRTAEEEAPGGDQTWTPRPHRTAVPAADLVSPPEIATTAGTADVPAVGGFAPRAGDSAPPTRACPLTNTSSTADSGSSRRPRGSSVPRATDLVPPPRILPFPTTTSNDPADSSTDSDSASLGLASSVAILKPPLSPDEFDSCDSL